jgi:ATP-binding cassette subfamily B protein
VSDPALAARFEDNTAAFERDILKENKPSFRYLIRLFRYVFSSAKAICGIFLGLSVLLSLLQPLAAFLWGRYIGGANALAESADAQWVQLASLVGLTVLYVALDFVIELINRYVYGSEYIERLSVVQDNRLREKFHAKLYRKIARLYPEYLEVPRINDIIARSFKSIGDEWSPLQRGVMIEGYAITARAVSVVAAAASLYLFHPLLSLIVLLAPLPTLYTTYVGNKLEFRFTRDNTKILREADYYQGVLLGPSAKEVKVLNLFDFFFAKWKALADDYLIRETRNQRNVFLLCAASGFVANLANVAANVFAIVLLTRGELTIGALGAVLSMSGTLMANTSQLFGSIAGFLAKKHEAAQFFELIDLKEQEAGDEDVGPALDIECLEARNVSYRYPLTGEYRIKNVNFTIRKGEKVAFVGENGAGKSTFVKLLTGMLEPSGGEMLINGVRIVPAPGRRTPVRCARGRVPGAGAVQHVHGRGQRLPRRCRPAAGRGGDRRGPRVRRLRGRRPGRAARPGHRRHGPVRRPVAEDRDRAGVLPGARLRRTGRADEQSGPAGRNGNLPPVYGDVGGPDGHHRHAPDQRRGARRPDRRVPGRRDRRGRHARRADGRGRRIRAPLLDAGGVV